MGGDHKSLLDKGKAMDRVPISQHQDHKDGLEMNTLLCMATSTAETNRGR